MRGLVFVFAFVGMIGAGCSASQGDTGVRVGVGASLVFPRGVFDNVRKLTLTAYETADGVDCAADGTASGPTSNPIATKELASQGCADGVEFCGELSIVQSDSARVFFAAGFSGAGDRVANGCTMAIVNQDDVPVEIEMRRFVKPAFCGNGLVEPTEQCEKPDGACDDSCHTDEVYLSGGHGAPSTAKGRAGDKKTPAFLWPASTGDAGRFVALFGDKTPGPSEVTMRVLSDSFAPYTKQGNEMANYSFFLPNDNAAGATFPPAAEAQNQSAPSVAFAAGKYYVVYQDDLGGNPEIHLRSLSALFAAEQGPQMPIGINGNNGAGESGSQIRPSIALGSNGLLFVAWEDMTVHGRTFNPSNGALGKQHDDLSSGSSSHGIKVASLGNAGTSVNAMYVATWESGSDVKMRLLGAEGAPIGTERTVNDASHSGAQVHPSVAALPDGRFAIVWNDLGRKGGDIFMQRYALDASGAQPVRGDQLDPVNDLLSDGEQTAPVVAAESAAGGSYVAAWVDVTSGHVRARFVGGSEGFLFNHIDGQETEFQASVVAGRARANPTIAVGGAGTFVAIGWEDTTNDDRAGIYGRRLPVGE